jgi:hypothetical protein
MTLQGGFSCSALLCTAGVIAYLLFAFLSPFFAGKMHKTI